MTNDSDPLVSAEYHRLADESAPGELNRAVLRASRKGAGRDTVAKWHSAWFRPLAGAAVIMLSVAVMMEFNEISQPESPGAFGDETLRPDNADDAFRDATDIAAQQIRAAEAAATRAVQNSGPADVANTSFGTIPDQTTGLPSGQGCDARQRATTGAWWQCVESLQNRGAIVQAEQELAALLQSYPAFDVPGQ